MKAVVIEKPGGPEVLALKDVPEPAAAHQEVKVRIKATAVNRADILQRMGHYPAPPDTPPDIPGLEFAGVIESVGSGVSDLAPGDRVFGLASGGTYAEYVVVHQRTVAPIPKTMSFVEAASVPEVFITAYDAMITQCALQPGETVLVHAVGSGVGIAAVQIARAIGARSIGTARSKNKLERASEFGLDHGILVSDGGFAQDVLRANGQGVNVVLELVGGSYVAEDLLCMLPKGRLIVVGLVGGLKAEIDLGVVLRNRLVLRGTTLRMRPLEEKIIATQLLSKNLLPMFEKGLLKPVIDNVIPLAKAGEAHSIMDRNENFGKIVLDLEA